MTDRGAFPYQEARRGAVIAEREDPGVGAGERRPPPPNRLTSARDLAKFTGLVALFAIFADAAVGHALLWENDPYWTYWVTKTFLIATIFGLGSAWLGIGIGRGAVITAVHGLVLTIYYWSLSPIGLPSHPEWLDLEHTWGTGVPVHFGVIYLGYLASLWLWRRRERLRAQDATPGPDALSRYAGTALGVGAGIVVVGGALVSLALGDFPGATWFLVRLLIAVPFLLAWWTFAGRDRVAAVAGGITLAFVFGTYSHFLGPVGLPDLPLRIFDQAPPEATARWLSYRQEWLISVPILLVVAVAALVLASRRDDREPGAARTLGLPALVVVVLAAGLGGLAALENEPGGDTATLAAMGATKIEQGSWYSNHFAEGTGELRLVATERNPRVTPLPPHDGVDLVAAVRHPNGTTYEIVADRPMVEDPLGRHTTWWGVRLNHGWHHGDSGIGTRKLPAVHSEVTVFALARVSADGREVASGVPIHVMTSDSALPGRIELDVGDEDISIPALPDGHLRVTWSDYSGGAGQGPERARNALGSGVLVGLLVLATLAVRREESRGRAGAEDG
ncbi:MAG: hypothetical protein M3314_01135 [Actinomycetota bacterium]|nr:hypothetical protein [Actinomycetota bacterium]